ncbi:MAG: M48 family metallopeptidase [Archangium sp.]
MKRVLSVVVFAVALQGCALFSSVTNKVPGAGNLAAEAEARAKKVAELTPAAKKHAEDVCNPILKEETPWPEERALGGVVAVSKLKASKGFLEGETEKDPGKLMEGVNAGKPPVLPDGAKNDITAQLSIVGKNLARFSSRPDLPWTFGVVTNDTPNALSAPGGYVFVTTGLLKKITNEAQLAGVLGHEIAHIVLKHSLVKYRDGKQKQCIAATFVAYLAENGIPPSEAQKDFVEYAKNFAHTDLDGSQPGFITFLMGVVIEVLQGNNDKDSEFAADAMALELTAFAGYDTAEYGAFLTSLGSSGGFLSSHPATEERVTKLDALRKGDLAPFATGTAKPDLSKLLAPVK